MACSRKCYTNILAAQNTDDKHSIILDTVINGVAAIDTQAVARLYMVNAWVQEGLIRKLFEASFHTGSVSFSLLQTKCQDTVYIDGLKVFVSTLAKPISGHLPLTFPWLHGECRPAGVH